MYVYFNFNQVLKFSKLLHAWLSNAYKHKDPYISKPPAEKTSDQSFTPQHSPRAKLTFSFSQKIKPLELQRQRLQRLYKHKDPYVSQPPAEKPSNQSFAPQRS